MNLIRIGSVVLNVDRINGIQDPLPPTQPPASGHPQTFIRVLFDECHIDLAGADANVFRRWYRHAARDLAPRMDEDGEELVMPEDQVRQAFDALLNRIDHLRPRDHALRSATHTVSGMVDRYITGELEPVRASRFARQFGETVGGAEAALESHSS
jgi:hypothetical protein